VSGVINKSDRNPLSMITSQTSDFLFDQLPNKMDSPNNVSTFFNAE